MKTKGRARSTNIEDRRSPFGSEAVGNGINWKDNVNSFMMESFGVAQNYSRNTYNTLQRARPNRKGKK